MARQDPLRNYRYRLEIDNIEQAGFAEVAIGDLSTEAIEYREGNEITTVRKLNGLNKYENITLKWGITDSTELADWHGRADPRNGAYVRSPDSTSRALCPHVRSLGQQELYSA